MSELPNATTSATNTVYTNLRADKKYEVKVVVSGYDMEDALANFHKHRKLDYLLISEVETND